MLPLIYIYWILLIMGSINRVVSETPPADNTVLHNHHINLHHLNWLESSIGSLSKNPRNRALVGHLQEAAGNNSPEGKGFVQDAVKAYYLAQVQKTSDFPTAFTTANISEQCKNDSLKYYSAHQIKNLQLWALQMYESSGKNPEGLFGSATLQAMGLFDECLDVKTQSFNDTTTGYWTEVDFSGQYCSVFFTAGTIFPNETDYVQTNNSEQQKRGSWIYWAQILQDLVNGPNVSQPLEMETDFNSIYLPRIDFCIPSSCSYQDLRTAVASFVGKQVISSLNDTENNQLYFKAVSTLSSDGYCFTKEKIKASLTFDGPDIAVIVTLSLLGLMALLATLYESWREFCDRPIDSRKEGLPIRFLHCFSVLNNGRKILSTKANSSDNLACLNGIRVLSTTWVILGHAYVSVAIHAMFDGAVLFEEAYKWPFHGAVTMGTLAVDTFFVMSGLLVAYLLLRELERNKGRFNVFHFYIHRYLRLTPVYAVILGFIATLMIYTTTGPNWETQRILSTACRYNWWNNLLYINNYVKTYPLDCMGETWYLACDMQLFVLSPLFIYPLWRWWKVGLGWLIFAIIAIQGGLVAIFIIWNLPATSFATRPIEMGNTHLVTGYYQQMWARSPPYLFGILLGWILHRTKGSQLKMNKVVVTVGWMASIATGLSVLYGLLPYLDETAIPEMNDFTRVAFGAFNRLAWAVAVGWIIFACIKGYGGFVNRFLSWKAFIPLGRLTYVVYLTHLNYLDIFWNHMRKPYYYTIFDQIQQYLGVVLAVFLIAFFISVTVEAPFLNLEKLLFSPAQKEIRQLKNDLAEKIEPNLHSVDDMNGKEK